MGEWVDFQGTVFSAVREFHNWYALRGNQTFCDLTYLLLVLHVHYCLFR